MKDIRFLDDIHFEHYADDGLNWDFQEFKEGIEKLHEARNLLGEATNHTVDTNGLKLQGNKQRVHFHSYNIRDFLNPEMVIYSGTRHIWQHDENDLRYTAEENIEQLHIKEPFKEDKE